MICGHRCQSVADLAASFKGLPCVALDGGSKRNMMHERPGAPLDQAFWRYVLLRWDLCSLAGPVQTAALAGFSKRSPQLRVRPRGAETHNQLHKKGLEQIDSVQCASCSWRWSMVKKQTRSSEKGACGRAVGQRVGQRQRSQRCNRRTKTTVGGLNVNEHVVQAVCCLAR